MSAREIMRRIEQEARRSATICEEVTSSEGAVEVYADFSAIYLGEATLMSQRDEFQGVYEFEYKLDKEIASVQVGWTNLGGIGAGKVFDESIDGLSIVVRTSHASVVLDFESRTAGALEFGTFDAECAVPVAIGSSSSSYEADGCKNVCHPHTLEPEFQGTGRGPLTLDFRSRKIVHVPEGPVIDSRGSSFVERMQAGIFNS